MKTYQVKDWDKNFENNKSRERDQCSFVCIPNKQDGLGLIRILMEKDGPSIYGIWHLIVGALSRQHKPRNGWMTDDGHQTGTAWAPDCLALRWRRKPEEIQRALEVLSSESVGWLNVTEAVPAECPLGAREVPAECPTSALKEGRKERRKEAPRKELTDEEWIDEQKALPKYSHINFDAQFKLMDAWLLKHLDRTKSRGFITNWLNGVDKPISVKKEAASNSKDNLGSMSEGQLVDLRKQPPYGSAEYSEWKKQYDIRWGIAK